MSGSGPERAMKVTLSVVFLSSVVSGQDNTRPETSFTADSTTVVILGFERALETFHGLEQLSWNQFMAGGFIDIDQRFRTRVIRAGHVLTQDDFDLRLMMGFPMSQSWDLRLSAISATVTDNSTVDLADLSRHQLLGGSSIRFSPGFLISAFGGYEAASQLGVHDEGPAALVQLDGAGVRLDEFDISGRARFGRSWPGSRTFEGDSVSVTVVRSFSEGTSNAFGFIYARQGRELFVPADPDVQRDFQRSTNIFRRVSQDVSVGDTITVQTGSASLGLHAALSNRTIDRSYRYRSVSNPSSSLLDVSIEEGRVVGGGSVRVQLSKSLWTALVAEFEEREERHSVRDDGTVPRQTFDRQNQTARRLTNIARRSTLGLSAEAFLGEKDLLNLSGSASILRYDTPDSLNVDDRDELLILLAVEETHRFGGALTLSVLADAALSHLVYLSRFQSANNSWNRIIRFKPTVTYVPVPWLVTMNSAEVLANYTVYDFEEQLQSIRSFSFRQAQWSDSTWIHLGSSLEALIQASLRIYERGILRWQEFRERPENYFVEQSLWPQLVFSVRDHLLMSIGYRYFSQARYRYEGRTRMFERRFASSGPTVRMSWQGVRGARIQIEGWRQTQYDTMGASRGYSNLSVTVGMML